MKKVPNSSQKSRERESFEQCRERDGERVAGGAGEGAAFDLRLAEGGGGRRSADAPASAASRAGRMTRGRRRRRASTAARQPTSCTTSREERQEQQLPRRRAGGQHSHHEAALFGEPAVDDRGAQDEGGHLRSPFRPPRPTAARAARAAVIRGRQGHAAWPPALATPEMVVRTPRRSMKAAANGPSARTGSG